MQPEKPPAMTKQALCPNCKTRKHTVKAGLRKTQQGTRQMHRCKKCEKKFTPGLYTRMRTSPEMINAALRLRNTGMSYRKISIALLLMYDVDVSDVTVMKWTRKYARN